MNDATTSPTHEVGAVPSAEATLPMQGLRVLVLGLGDSGLVMLRWCVRQGAEASVWDSREHPPQAAALAEELPTVQRLHGELPASALAGVDRVLKSPGLSPLDTRLAALLQAAAEAEVPVWGELDLFAEALARLQRSRGYQPQVLAITGTNGKTTTTALTALLVERAGRSVIAAGNIGPTMLGTLQRCLDEQVGIDEATAAERAAEAEAAAAAAAVAQAEAEAAAEAKAKADRLAAEIARAEGREHEAVEPEAAADEAAMVADVEAAEADDDEDSMPAPWVPQLSTTNLTAHKPHHADGPQQGLPEVWVLELSSFQLDGVRHFEPSAATVLNITQDHLDWHGHMAGYTAAKARIFGQQAVMVINRDEAVVEALVPVPTPVVKGKAKTKADPAAPVVRPRHVVRFGLDAPQQPGDFGLVQENGMAWLVRAHPLDPTIKRKKGEEVEIHLQRLMPADALRLRGRHNASNALAALALASSIGCPLAPMLHGLREYEGEPHRVQWIGNVGDVEAFDDSKGTNVGATVAALTGLGADKAPAKLVVILGGDGKGQDFAPLAAPVQRFARAVATIGRDAQAIEQALQPLGDTPLQRHATLEAAVAWCFQQAQPGDAVLLSPACASLDMFRNYAHRADVFVQAVQALAQEQGIA
ncbi:MAG: UDP-N-acetylmuramoyl-L-alanine--D-glutamate ligase [Rubrivivax sp.]